MGCWPRRCKNVPPAVPLRRDDFLAKIKEGGQRERRPKGGDRVCRLAMMRQFDETSTSAVSDRWNRFERMVHDVRNPRTSPIVRTIVQLAAKNGFPQFIHCASYVESWRARVAYSIDYRETFARLATSSMGFRGAIREISSLTGPPQYEDEYQSQGREKRRPRNRQRCCSPAPLR